MASEIMLVARVAEKACAAAVNDPRNADVRVALFNAVAALVDAVGQERTAKHSVHIHYLLRQAGVLVDIVRCRIVNSRNSNTATTASLIQYPTRELQQLLSQLLEALVQSACSSG
jgi:hypothetical protein